MALFVDVHNMYRSAKKIYDRNLSYAKMLRLCVRNSRLTRALAYVIEREDTDQASFLNYLRFCGFEVCMREVIERADVINAQHNRQPVLAPCDGLLSAQVAL